MVDGPAVFSRAKTLLDPDILFGDELVTSPWSGGCTLSGWISSGLRSWNSLITCRTAQSELLDPSTGTKALSMVDLRQLVRRRSNAGSDALPDARLDRLLTKVLRRRVFGAARTSGDLAVPA